MEIIDPWRGMVEGSKAIYGLGKEAKEQVRQSELDKRAREKWEYEKADLEAKQAERKALLDYEQTLRDLRTKKITETLPEKDNPEYADYQSGLSALTTAQYPEAPKDVLDNSLANAMQAEGLAESTPSPEGRAASLAGAVPPAKLPAETVTRPLSPFEYYKEAEQARMQYDPTGARKAGGVDITAEVMRSAPLKMMEAHQKGKIAMDMYAQGRSPEEIAQYLNMSAEEVAKGLQETKQIAPGILYRETNGLGITLNYTGKGDPVHITKLTTEKMPSSPQALRVRNEAERMVKSGEAENVTAALPQAAENVKQSDTEQQFNRQWDMLQARQDAADRRFEKRLNFQEYRSSVGPADTAYRTAAKYSTMAAGFENKINNNADLLKEFLSDYEKEHPIAKYRAGAVINDILAGKITGSGKYANIQNIASSIEMELGKLEAGSYGTAGATKHATDAFSRLKASTGFDNIREQLDGIKRMAASAKRSQDQATEQAAENVNAVRSQYGLPELGKTAPSGKAKGQLDAATAKQYLQKAGGDKAKARELAKADGWSF